MNLKLDKEKALEAYKNGNSTIKQFLIDSYGAEHFLIDIKDRVTSYEAACEILGKTPLTLSQFSFLGDKESKRQFARHKIATGIEAINEGWVADFENESVWKYYVYMRNKFRSFSFGVVGGFYRDGVGSDLYVESREKAEIIAKVFLEDYKIYLYGYK